MMLDDLFNRCIPEPNSGCWLWTGAERYGIVRIGQRQTGAHRLALGLHLGQMIPDNLQVCHRCDTPSCINPDHLFVGTNSDNVRDAMKKGRAYDVGAPHRKKTHCPSGHAYEGRNLILYQGRRYCRACMYRHNRKAA